MNWVCDLESNLCFVVTQFFDVIQMGDHLQLNRSVVFYASSRVTTLTKILRTG